MKSISYTVLSVLLALTCFTGSLTAQSVNEREVLTEEQYNNASAERQSEIRDNPGQYVVVKDGQKVDIWSESDSKSSPGEVNDKNVAGERKGVDGDKNTGVRTDDGAYEIREEPQAEEVEEVKIAPHHQTEKDQARQREIERAQQEEERMRKGASSGEGVERTDNADERNAVPEHPEDLVPPKEADKSFPVKGQDGHYESEADKAAGGDTPAEDVLKEDGDIKQ